MRKLQLQRKVIGETGMNQGREVLGWVWFWELVDWLFGEWRALLGMIVENRIIVSSMDLKEKKKRKGENKASFPASPTQDFR